jgi:hypothetical protein
MTSNAISVEEIDEITSVERYIEILLEEYPNAISQKELAEKTAVTKSAISKIREKVVIFCDVKTLGYTKKLLLGQDEATFSKLLVFFINRFKPQVFFRSRYVKAFIENMSIHEKLVNQLEKLSYGEYFEKEDTEIFIQIVLRNLSRFPQPFLFDGIRHLRSREAKSLVEYAAFVPFIMSFLTNFDMAVFVDKEELIQLLRLRDKVFSFILDNAERYLRNWEVLQDVDARNKKETYVEAYVKVIDYYLRKFSDAFTSSMEKRAGEIGVEFKKNYFDIGSFK